MNSGGAPKICSRPNFWKDMITSWTSGQPTNTAIMMNAGVSSASGAHGNRRARRGSGPVGPPAESGGVADGETDGDAERVATARLLSVQSMGMARGAPHAGRPVSRRSPVEDRLDLLVRGRGELLHVTAACDLHEEVLHDALGLHVRPVRRRRGALRVGGRLGDHGRQLRRGGGEL